MSDETETVVRPCCSMCLIVPDDPAAIEKRLEYVEYWLCTDRTACLDRATAQQHEAREAEEAVKRAVVNEKKALEADVDEVKAALQPEGKHAATGPLQTLTDAAVAEIAETAEKADGAAPADGEACHD